MWWIFISSVRPPKKSWKNISNLSGGEKTLSSLALVFALHHYKPTPLYVMDEIDAALDFKNVSIVGHYIKVGKFCLVGLPSETQYRARKWSKSSPYQGLGYRLGDSLVVECWLRVREVPGSIPSQGPPHTKDVIKIVPVVTLKRENTGSFSRIKTGKIM